MIRYLTRTRKLTEASLIHHTKPRKTEKVKTTVDMLRRYGNHLQHWLLFSSLSMVSSLWRMADSEYIFEIREQIDIQTRWSQYFAFSRRRSNQYRPDGTASICPADSHFNHFWDLAMRMSTANDRQTAHSRSQSTCSILLWICCTTRDTCNSEQICYKYKPAKLMLHVIYSKDSAASPQHTENPTTTYCFKSTKWSLGLRG